MARIVPARFQERGRALYRKRVVFIQRGNHMEVHAQVLGSQLYYVELALEDGRLASSCTCPYFAGGAAYCKHIWATLLAAEARGYLEGDFEDAGDAGWAEDGGDLTPLTDQQILEAVESFSRELDVPAVNHWESQLRDIASDPAPVRSKWPSNRQILYVLRAPDSDATGKLVIDVVHREPKRDGSWRKPKSVSLNPAMIGGLPQALDREILSMILGSADAWTGTYSYYASYARGPSVPGSELRVPVAVIDAVVPLIVRSGRGLIRLTESPGEEPVALTEDPADAWEFRLVAGAAEGGYLVNGVLSRENGTMDLGAPAILVAGGFVVGSDGVVSRLKDFGAIRWISTIRRSGPLHVPAAQSERFLSRLLELPNLPPIELPPELDYSEQMVTPQPRLQVKAAETSRWASRRDLKAELSFDYEGELIGAGDPAAGVLKSDPRRLLLRDRDAEAAALDALADLGIRPAPGLDYYLLKPHKLPAVARALTQAGWHVEAEGSLYRTGGVGSVRVSSGVDWFELDGTMEFGDQTATLPELLAAVRRGEDFVRLDDGTFGLLPEEWLKQYSTVAGLGTVSGDSIRFKNSQLSLIDALLATRPEVSFDETFVRARQQLMEFRGVTSIHEPEGFVGELRAYQREGLGWFEFLQQFGFGGCLADDMGLGKTVQVLALLEGRRGRGRPSLVVVPKSLIFNWVEEAHRFTPQLSLLDHTGPRDAPGRHFAQHDVILTTYGTLRSDAAHFSNVQFDYCILDEAQAIKNPATASAKAARLIQADHRLALSGTPIENHLGELWSLLDFLNPGMLGSSGAFQKGISDRNPDEGTRRALSGALRPFILRRTKEQVATDLPAKTEQTQYCELLGPQRKQYDQLRDHYRRDLLERLDRDGMAKSKIFVLEALLRLRQAACHPGLIDPKRTGDASAKLDLLLPQLVEVAEEGHKAIVFSQFTSFLAILKERLDREGVAYEYLDGRTRNRQERVENFQNNPDCRLFLISLKAGGLGLNLTAAEYVFLLDPWWNPAVEAQAIDRAHRIGQDKAVFAYRIIARNTVEEKVLQLQQSKRALADAIITADNSLIRQIRREDLELLLS